MIAAGVCSKCEKCIEVVPSEESPAGEIVRQLYVDCRLGGILVQSSEIPEGCLMRMEQTICEQEAADAVSAIECCGGVL